MAVISPHFKADQPVIAAAASRHTVPLYILWGVYGVETGFGVNVRTSSAGAMGAFQFIPSTAHAYGYPLSNNRADFPAQADAAARYLHDLKQQNGTWEAALRHYSGGGYGLSTVAQKAAGAGFFPSGNDSVDAGFLGSGVGSPSGLPNPLKSVESIGGFLSKLDVVFSGGFWLRAGMILGGGVLAGWAIVEIGKQYGATSQFGQATKGAALNLAKYARVPL